MAAELETTWPQILAWRMRRQLLDPVGQVDAPDVVRRLCGIQAQVPAGSGRPTPSRARLTASWRTLG